MLNRQHVSGTRFNIQGYRKEAPYNPGFKPAMARR